MTEILLKGRKTLTHPSNPSLSVRSEKGQMNEGRPIYNVSFLPGANRPEVEKLP